MGNGIRQIALLWVAFFALSNLSLHPKQNHSNVGLPRLEQTVFIRCKTQNLAFNNRSQTSNA